MTTGPAGQVSADELAAAMRSGLASRRFFRPLPPVAFPPPPGETIFPQLDYYRRPESAPTTTVRLPVVGWLFRIVRAAVGRLIAPWLEHQAGFNDAVAAYLRTLHPYLHEASARHAAALREIVPAYQATHARLGEFARDVSRLKAGKTAGEPAPPADPVDVIEGLFLHTRIGPPPGRVLVLAPATLAALDLASLGFQAVLHSPTYEQPAHPGLRLVTPNASGGLPYPDESFDFVVAFGGGLDRDEIVRVLVPGGKTIASRPVDDSRPDGSVPGRDELTGHLVELAFAERVGHGWTLSGEPGHQTEIVLWVSMKG